MTAPGHTEVLLRRRPIRWRYDAYRPTSTPQLDVVEAAREHHTVAELWDAIRKERWGDDGYAVILTVAGHTGGFILEQRHPHWEDAGWRLKDDLGTRRAEWDATSPDEGIRSLNYAVAVARELIREWLGR